MKTRALLTLSLFVLMLAVACSAAQPGLRENFPAAAAPTAAPAATSAPAPTSAPSGGRAYDSAIGGFAPALPQEQVDRMIVYNGSLSLEVAKTEDAVAKIGDIVRASNGYISAQSLVRESGSDQLRGTITVRIPATGLATVLNQIKAIGIKVLREDANSSDVTQEYVDLDARRKNLEAYEVELQKLLETVRESTGKADDILAVYNQLTQVRGEIEQIKGRQQYLQNTSTYATYTIELVPQVSVTPTPEAGWDPAATARRAARALLDTLQVLGDVAIVLAIYVLPLVVLPLLIFVWIARRLMRRRAPKKPVPA